MAILFDWYENPKTKDKLDEELTLHPRIRLNGSTVPPNYGGSYKNIVR